MWLELPPALSQGTGASCQDRCQQILRHPLPPEPLCWDLLPNAPVRSLGKTCSLNPTLVFHYFKMRRSIDNTWQVLQMDSFSR